MSETQKKGDVFKEFILQSAWTLVGGPGGDWRRERKDGVLMEIIHMGNGFYQVIANRGGPYARYDRKCFRFANMDEAKRRAWLVFNEARDTMPNPDDGLPALVEWA